MSSGSSLRNKWAPYNRMDSTVGQKSCLEMMVCRIDHGRNSDPKEHEDSGSYSMSRPRESLYLRMSKLCSAAFWDISKMNGGLDGGGM
jgi:hypothetical protein